MNIREEYEEFEEKILNKRASLSKNSKGRAKKENKCHIRTEFQRDRDRIIHSKSFRRLKEKTQVFISPGDHYRTRLTHTLEVSQISRTIARGLHLNEDLTEAIALGHDLGHSPFGHSGEAVLNRILLKKGVEKGFSHSRQSKRVVEVLEKDGEGLNLTYEVIDGIRHHNGSGIPITLEGQIVKISDRVAYLNHDIDDAIRGKLLKFEDLPQAAIKILGTTHSDRINKLVEDLIQESKDKDVITQSQEVKEAMNLLRQYMFENVYLDSRAKVEEIKVERLIKEMFYFLENNTQELPLEFQDFNSKEQLWENITDYISGMTDSYAVKVFKSKFLPLGYDNNDF